MKVIRKWLLSLVYSIIGNEFYYMDGIGIDSVETETFKTEMPKIFPDWTWENFIAKFESLRLSNKNK